MLNLDDMKIILNNSPLDEDIKTKILDSITIFYEFVDFLAEKLGTTREVADESFKLNYKIELAKAIDKLDPDEDYIDVAVNILVDMARKDGFTKLDELKESSKYLLTIKL